MKRPVEMLPKCKYRFCQKPMLRNKDFCNHKCKHAEFVAITEEGGDGSWIYHQANPGKGRPRKDAAQKAPRRKEAEKAAQQEFKMTILAKHSEPPPARHRQKPTISPPQDMMIVAPTLIAPPRTMKCPRCNDRKPSVVKDYAGEQPHREILPGLFQCERCGRVRAGDGPDDDIVPALTIGASDLDRVTFTQDNILSVPVCETTAGVGPANYIRLLVSSRDIDRKDGSDQVNACKVSAAGDYWQVEIGARIGKQERME